MSEAEQVSSLIGDLYDAALDPELWPQVLEKACRFIRGAASNLYSEDSAAKTGNIHYTWGVDRHYGRLYYDKYIKFNPFTTAQLFFDVGEIVTLGDIVPLKEFRESLFYKEWAKPQGWIDAASALLEKSGTSYAAFSVIRHERDGLIDEAARERMGLLVPHVRRSVLIGKVIELHKAEASTLADTLDGLTAGMFLVDNVGRIVHANASGQTMVAEAKFVRAAGGRLIAIDPLRQPDAAGHLRGGRKRRRGGRREGDFRAAQGARRRRARGACAAAHRRHAAQGGHLLCGGGRGVRAQGGARYPVPARDRARRHQLTPSELRVLLAIVEVGGAPEVAQALGVSETTVKTHLRHIFEKTGTSRQADLVKLVAGFSFPLLA